MKYEFYKLYYKRSNEIVWIYANLFFYLDGSFCYDCQLACAIPETIDTETINAARIIYLR